MTIMTAKLDSVWLGFSSKVFLIAVAGLCAGVMTSPVHAQSLERTSVAPGGVQTDNISTRPVISAGGAFVVFASDATNLITGDTNGNKDIFLLERATGAVTRVSVGFGGTEPDGDSGRPVVSTDGRYIAFRSDATNLISLDPNGMRDIFCTIATWVPRRSSAAWRPVSVATAAATVHPFRQTVVTLPTAPRRATSSPVTRMRPMMFSCSIATPARRRV